MKKIVIVEDESFLALQIKQILENNNFEVIGITTDIVSTKEILSTKKPDLILLDIRLDTKMDGFIIAEYIDKNYQIPYIYLSAYSDEETMKRIMMSNPVSYILKPFHEKMLLTNIRLYFKQKKEKDQSSKIEICEANKKYILALNEIIYFSTDGNYTYLHTFLRKYIFKKSLKELLKLLNSPHFIRIHKSFAVNTINIKIISSYEITMKNNTILSIGRNYKNQVKKIELFEL